MENVIITGTGCIAAAYLGRVNSSPSSFPATCPAASSRPRRRWKNLPGFPNGIRGPELTMNMQTQAEKFGSRIEHSLISSVKKTAAGRGCAAALEAERHLADKGVH